MDTTAAAGSQRMIEKGMMIYGENQSVENICILLKGKVSAVGKAGKLELLPGSCIGLVEGVSGKYLYSYFTEEESILISFPHQEFVSQLGIFTALSTRTKGIGNLVLSASSQLMALAHKYRECKRNTIKFYEYVKYGYEDCKKLYGTYQIAFYSSERIEELEPLDMEDTEELNALEYFEHLMNMPATITNGFFAHSQYITIAHLQQMLDAAEHVEEMFDEVYQYASERAECLLSEEKESLFGLYENLLMQAYSKKVNVNLLHKKIDSLLEFAEKFEGLDKKAVWKAADEFEDKCQMFAEEKIEDRPEPMENDKYSPTQLTVVRKQTENSLETIIMYAGMSEDKNKLLRHYVTAYGSMEDKKSAADECKEIRNKLTTLFYEYYDVVFFKAIEKESVEQSPVIDLFLNYGYMDEHLLSNDQLMDLYYFRQDEDCGGYHIFTMREWLHAIYEGKHEPSKNEFDLDYMGVLREEKKQRVVSPEKEKAYMKDQKGKVRFELNNMLRSANKVTQGQVLSFCPVFCPDNAEEQLDKIFLLKSTVKKAVDEFLQLDYSCFWRPVYEGPNKEVETEVLPIIILMPNIGTRGVMWQELSGIKKDTPARFAFSVFEREQLSKLVVNVLGQFRWELCRSIQGIYWNDIHERSLTSEYSDYAQFYKKNRDLTPAVKDKIRLKLAKCKNNYRNMFVSDYTEWILYESNSSVRLNKLNREILYKYCPLPKEIREQMKNHPSFSGLVERYENILLKREKEVKKA